MQRRHWFTNRVIWGLLFFLVSVAVWEFRFKAQYRPFYENGVVQYQKGNFIDSLEEFQRAYVIAPNSTDVLLMMGWSNLKLHRFEEARFYFERTLAIDPRVIEARFGLSFVVLETGRGTIDVEAMTKVLEERPKDTNIQIVAAGALLEQGENLKAMQMYQALLGSANYHRAADAALRQMFGLDDSEPVPAGLTAFTKPSQLQVPFRARDNAIWRASNADWQKFYVAGVNFMPDVPGLTPGMVPKDPGFYAKWLQEVQELGANTLHIYSLLPPAFYRSYQRSGNGIALLQQISFDLPDDGDLFEKPFETAKADIRYAIDAVHGQGNVPQRGRRASGLYVADVSANVVGFILGGDLQPAAAQTTNVRNLQKSSYTGKYVSISGGNATEVWIAQLLDYAAQYETDTYGWQHPVAFANRPTFDTMVHPTESTTTRNDQVSIDESKFRISPNFSAGLFASYEVRSYFPDFMLRESRVLAGTDAQGPNPIAAYVRDLRSRIPLPLVISDFGIPAAIGIQHMQSAGWSQGGISESEQATLLTRMAQAIKNAGCAGASVHQLIDEWYRANGVAADFEVPRDRGALWLNEMSPDSRFGLVGFRSSQWQLFAGNGSAWKNERTLYTNPVPAGPEPGKNLRSVQVGSDEAFLYLRLNLSCAECRGQSPSTPQFAIAINTMPRRAGVQNMPFGNVQISTGANFLLYIGQDGGRLLVAGNYNPFQIINAPGAPNNNEFRRRKPFVVSMQADGGFEDLVLEINEPVYGRDGVYYPPQRYSASTLRRAQNVGRTDVDSIAEWYADTAQNAIVIRLPWGKLLVTDPSASRVFAGYQPSNDLRTDTSDGVQVSVFSLARGTASNPRSWAVAGSLPAMSGNVVGNPVGFTWKPWNNVTPESYRKAAFTAMQKIFGGHTNAATARPAAASTKVGTP